MLASITKESSGKRSWVMGTFSDSMVMALLASDWHDNLLDG
jgi:hypothetical protein